VVRDHAHDLDIDIVRRVEEGAIEHLEPDALADRILAGQVLIGKRLVDNRDEPASLDIRLGAPVRRGPRSRPR